MSITQFWLMTLGVDNAEDGSTSFMQHVDNRHPVDFLIETELQGAHVLFAIEITAEQAHRWFKARMQPPTVAAALAAIEASEARTS